MKRLIAKALALCILISLLSLCSCADRKQKYTRTSLSLFDTHSVLIGYEKNEKDFEKTADAVFELLEKYHRLFDIYYEYDGINNLKTVNKNAGITPVKVDPEVIDLLLFSKEISRLTNNKTNIAMGSVLSLWHEYRNAGLDDPENAALPEKAELEERAKHKNTEDIVIDEKELTVYLKDENMSLDVGAVAKGYATEKAAQLLSEMGKDGYALSIGGNVRCVGEKTKGEKWEVGVQNPDLDSDKPYIAKIEIADLSLVTSGTYQRFYTVDGKEYHHIIDPDTLFPGENFESVSVLTKDSALADALSTALFNMTEEEGRALLATLESTDAVWVYKNGDVSMTDGFEKHINN